MNRKGIAIVMVLAIISVGIIIGALLLKRSASQGTEVYAQKERGQAKLLAQSAIEIAKLKIKNFPTELYRAFYYKLDAAKKDNSLYNSFLNDLNLKLLDARINSENSPWTASITKIERLGITKSTTGVGSGYVDDYFRITAVAKSTLTGHGFKKLENEVTLNVTMQISKRN